MVGFALVLNATSSPPPLHTLGVLVWNALLATAFTAPAAIFVGSLVQRLFILAVVFGGDFWWTDLIEMVRRLLYFACI